MLNSLHGIVRLQFAQPPFWGINNELAKHEEVEQHRSW